MFSFPPHSLKMQYKEVFRVPGVFFSVLSHDVQGYLLNFVLPRKGRVEQPLGDGKFVATVHGRHDGSVVDFRCTPRGEFLVTLFPDKVLRLSHDFVVIAEIRFPPWVCPIQALETHTGQIIGLIGNPCNTIVRENQIWLPGSCDQQITANRTETQLYILTARERTLRIIDLHSRKDVREFAIAKYAESFAVLSDDTILVMTSHETICCMYHYHDHGSILNISRMSRGFPTGCKMTIDAADVIFYTLFASNQVWFSRPPYMDVKVAVETVVINGHKRYVAVGLDGSLVLASHTGAIMQYKK
jgi:hypothetical protein